VNIQPFGRPAMGLALALVLALAGCGGADEARRAAEGAAAATTPAAAPGDRKRAMKLGNFEIQDLMSQIVFFDEAQAAFPELFGGFGATQTFGSYTYRYDSKTQNYLALTDTEIVLMGPVVNSADVPVTYAKLDDFCSVAEQAKFCGYKQVRKMMVGTQEREFIVYVPWKARTATNQPAVFMVHGTAQTAETFYGGFDGDMPGGSGWREVADRVGLIVVFPQALVHCFWEDDNGQDGVWTGKNTAKPHTPTKWAAGSLGNPTQRPLCTQDEVRDLVDDPVIKSQLNRNPMLADDMAFFDRMVDLLIQDYGVDRRSIYASGFSNGGEFTSRLAVERSTTYAAIAASAGITEDTGQPLPPRSVPFIFTAGERDDRYTTRLPPVAPPAVPRLPLTDSGADPTFQKVFVKPFSDPKQLNEAVYGFTPFTYTNPDDQCAATNPGCERTVQLGIHTYSTTDAGKPTLNVLHVAVVGELFHSYPTGRQGSHPLKMAEVLWGFFRDYHLP
jgi:poly(3-hydroxybutyrate) depolymerase